MLAWILAQSNLKGAHCIGVPLFSELDGGAFAGKDYFVAEADEYAHKPHEDNTPRFNFQHPDILICTNIDFDHPDVYASLEMVKQAFHRFMQRTIVEKGRVIYCADDPHSVEVTNGLHPESLYSYGTVKTADFVISDVKDAQDETSFSAIYRGEDCGRVMLTLSGMHNVKNAAAAILACKLTGRIENVAVQKALALFTGSQRRFELVHNARNTYLIDDYAHHPREIEAVIDAVRHRFPQQRIVVIFQPHTFSRTSALKLDFEKALQKADMTYVVDTFASEREKKQTQDAENTLLDKTYSEKELCENLSHYLKNGDVLLTIGAGDVYALHPSLIKIIDVLPQ